jgi:hypothetical protein
MNENVHSVVDSDELVLLEEVFELRPGMKSCRQHEDTGKGQERAIQSHWPITVEQHK